MPTIFRLLGFRFFYRLYDLVNEPCHVHVGDDNKKLCKFWICADDSVELADKSGFNTRDLSRIQKTIIDHLDEIKQHYEADCRTYNVPPSYKSKKGSIS